MKVIEYRDFLLRGINKEIDDLNSMQSSFINYQESNVTEDVTIMRSKLNAFRDAKEMIIKASLDVEGLDNVVTMSPSQKKKFYSLSRFLGWLTKPFR